MPTDDAILKLMRHSHMEDTMFQGMVTELAKSAAAGFVRDVGEQLRYERLRHNTLVADVMPVSLEGDRLYVVAAFFTISRSDADGVKFLAAFASALRQMLAEAQTAPESIVKFEKGGSDANG
jgi:hypothetical protein